MKNKCLYFTDFFGIQIKLFERDNRESCLRYYEAYLHPTLEFPDEIYFFKKDYCNKYIKYYQDFYVIVTVNLYEYSQVSGIQNRIPEWFVVHESVTYPYYFKSDKLTEITKCGELIYKYTPPNSYLFE